MIITYEIYWDDLTDDAKRSEQMIYKILYKAHRSGRATEIFCDGLDHFTVVNGAIGHSWPCCCHDAAIASLPEDLLTPSLIYNMYDGRPAGAFTGD